MNWPLIHIAINHVPIILIMLGGGAAILAWLVPRRALWLYAAATIALAGLSIYPTYLAGEWGEDAAAEIPGVSEHLIEEHEEAAKLSLWIVLAAGAAGAFAWWRLTRSRGSADLPTWLRVAVTVTALAGIASVGYTAFRGGAIRHPQEHGVSDEEASMHPDSGGGNSRSSR